LAILVSEIERGWVYRTPSNQERLVLGWDKDGRVVYSPRGGNAMNPFHNDRTSCSAETFARACSEKVRQVPDIAPFITANNAQDVVVR